MLTSFASRHTIEGKKRAKQSEWASSPIKVYPLLSLFCSQPGSFLISLSAPASMAANRAVHEGKKNSGIYLIELRGACINANDNLLSFRCVFTALLRPGRESNLANPSPMRKHTTAYRTPLAYSFLTKLRREGEKEREGKRKRKQGPFSRSSVCSALSTIFVAQPGSLSSKSHREGCVGRDR